jgi:hypothetical protein
MRQYSHKILCKPARTQLRSLALPRLHGSPAILMIEKIQAINLLLDRAENAVER